MSINKQDVRKKIIELRNVAHNPILNALANTFTRISREKITLDTTRERIYNFVIGYKTLILLVIFFAVVFNANSRFPSAS